MGGGGGGKGGKGAGQFEATDYRLSIHYAVCVGPVDEISAIIISDKDVGISPVVENTRRVFNDMSLFGGPKKGGGIKGTIDFLLGGASQILPDYLAAKLGRSPNSVTGYRNICSVWFHGSPVASTDPNGPPSFANEGFTWSTNVPSVPPPKVKVVRAPVGLSGDPMVGPDANPAHIVYECLVNPDWGVGYLPGELEEESFLSSAQVLRDENFGLSLIWTGQTSIEAFVNEVLQHIAGNLIYNLSSATWSLSLLRGGYDTSSLREINPRNSELKSFQRKSWGETINEVIVTWTNPENEEEETVTQQDATGFAIQKTSVSDSSRNYPGVRRQDLAWELAERDLRQSGTPLAAMEVDSDLSLRGVKPGDVLWFNWDVLDEDGDVFLPPTIVRVLKVKEPKRGAASFEISLIEDVFSFGGARTNSQDSQFVSPDQVPVDLQIYDIFDSPYFAIAQELGDESAQQIAFPRAFVSALVTSDLADIRDIELYSERPVPEQPPAYKSVADLADLDHFSLSSPLQREIESTVSFPANFFSRSTIVGGFLIFGSGAQQEICLVTAISGGDVTVKRGCLDTIPSIWPAGTPVWGVTRTAQVVDPTEVAVGEVLKYKFLPVTSRGRLKIEDATERQYTPGERAYLPLRPARVAVAAAIGANPPGTPQVGFNFEYPLGVTEVHVEWANRNRATETSQVLSWDNPGVTPEFGQTTTLEIFRAGAILRSVTGVTGESTVINLSNITFSVGDVLMLRVYSERDQRPSLNAVEIEIVLV